MVMADEYILAQWAQAETNLGIRMKTHYLKHHHLKWLKLLLSETFIPRSNYQKQKCCKRLLSRTKMSRSFHSQLTFLYKILNKHEVAPMNHLDWFSVIDLSENLLPNRDWRYLAVPQLSFKTLLLQELLSSGIHHQIPSPHWLRYHPSEASCLLYRTCRRAHYIPAVFTRSLAIIIQNWGIKSPQLRLRILLLSHFNLNHRYNVKNMHTHACRL